MDRFYEKEVIMSRLKKCPDCGGKMEKKKTNFIAESENG